ncbi:hypothetical protein FACS18948_7000 [Clostridia bacterium]|nr:hypothetical protein FACS18948_7000 [Clostridia bacterium]
MFKGAHAALPRKALNRTIVVFLIVMLASSAVISYAGLKISTGYVLRTSNDVKQDMLLVYKRSLESKLTAVYQQINLFLLDQDVWSLVYSDNETPDYLLVRDILEKIKALTYMNDLIASFCFFDQTHNYVLSDAYYRKEDYPDMTVFDEQLIAQGPISDTRIVDGEPVFSIVFRPMTTSSDNPITIVVNITHASLSNVLPLSEDIGHFVIVNSREKPIYSSDADLPVGELLRLMNGEDMAPRVLTIGGERYVSAGVQTSTYDLRLMIFQDYSSAVMRGSVLRSMLLISALLALLGSGVLAVLASYYLYQPLKDTVNALTSKGFSSGVDGEKNEYALISRVVDNLSESNREIERKYTQAYRYLDRYFFQEFLINSPLDTHAFAFMLSQRGLVFDYSYFCLIVLDLHSRTAERLGDVAMPDLLQYPNGSNILAGQIGTGRIAFLSNMKHGDTTPDEFVRGVKSWYNTLDFDVCAYYGNIFTNIEELPARYNDCDAMLGGKFFYGHDIILNECHVPAQSMAHDPKLERALLSAVKTTDEAKAQSLLDELIALYGEGRQDDLHETADAIGFFRFRLCRLCMDMIGDLGEDFLSGQSYKRFLEMQQANTIQEIRALMSGVVTMLVERNRNISQSRNAGLVERAKKYISENLSHEISLDEIAQAVYLSTNYFCGVFKAETGVTVMDYITERRIDISRCILIDSPAMQINELAKRMGYNSAQSFIRQFKRATGETPEQYRRKTLQSADKDIG